MATLNLSSVDEIIAVRQVHHGGGRGAPRINPDGTRDGQALNRAVVVMTSAALQAFCEDVFFETSVTKLGLNEDQSKSYKDLYSQWGNPSKENIRKSFRRLGVVDVLGGLSWQSCGSASVSRNLDRLNQIRNQIAHGRAALKINGNPYALTLAKARDHRNFVERFGNRFEAHAKRLLNIP